MILSFIKKKFFLVDWLHSVSRCVYNPTFLLINEYHITNKRQTWQKTRIYESSIFIGFLVLTDNNITKQDRQEKKKVRYPKKETRDSLRKYWLSFRPDQTCYLNQFIILS